MSQCLSGSLSYFSAAGKKCSDRSNIKAGGWPQFIVQDIVKAGELWSSRWQDICNQEE